MSQVTESRSGQFFEAHVSHPGAVRSENEDAFLARGGEGLWVVADGMGGLDDGQWASSEVAKRLAEAPLSGDLERDAAIVSEVVRHANFTIFRESTERANHIGSTVVALVVRGPRFAAIWAGDSRLYVWRGGQLAQVTTDHTQVQQMVAAGYITQREAADHPMSHVLARAVGTHAEVEPEVLTGEVQAGDLFLLCSDGLPRVVEDHEIAEALAAGNPSRMLGKLIGLALERGAPDNVTMVAVGCADPTGAIAGYMSAGAPILGGAASDAPAAKDRGQDQEILSPAAQAPRKGAGGAAALSAAIALLVIGGLAVGGWMLTPKARHGVGGTVVGPAAITQAPVPETGRRQFEAALGTVPCSALQIEKIGLGPSGVEMAIGGVAASPAAVQSALQAAATGAKLQVADIDLQSIAPTPPQLCSTLDALRPFRAMTTETGQNLTAAQDSFAIMKQSDGKEAGRAVVNATPPPGEFAVVELGADNALSLIAPDRRTFETMAAAGTVVSKLPEGGYRLQADYAKPGWSSVILISGKGPFPRNLLVQPAGPRPPAWASQIAAAAQGGGWRVETAWYDIATGGDLSVIPLTQGASNAVIPATNGLMPSPPPAKKPAATNALASPAPPAGNATAPAKPAAPATNAAKPAAGKSDVPL